MYPGRDHKKYAVLILNTVTSYWFSYYLFLNRE